MSIEPQIIKLLKKDALTTYELATKLIRELITYTHYIKTDLMHKDVQNILNTQINIYKNKIRCANNTANIQVDIGNAMQIAKIYDDYYETQLEMHAIFTFIETDEQGYLFDEIVLIINNNMKYVMLTFMMDEYNKILKRFLLADISMIILSYV